MQHFLDRTVDFTSPSRCRDTWESEPLAAERATLLGRKSLSPRLSVRPNSDLEITSNNAFHSDTQLLEINLTMIAQG